MEIRDTYKGKADRAEIIARWERLGYRMLHDNFDLDWKRGDEPHGEMIFTNEPSPAPEPSRSLEAEIDSLTARIGKLETRLKKIEAL